jgi:hypothetical protein
MEIVMRQKLICTGNGSVHSNNSLIRRDITLERQWTLRVLFAGLVMLAAGNSSSVAAQITHTASKEVKFTWKPNQPVTAIGTAIFGENYALDRNIAGPRVTFAQAAMPFVPNLTGASFEETTKDAEHGGALGETTISVGQFTAAPNGAIMVDARVDVRTVVPPPGPPGKGGVARARGRVNLPGSKMTVESLKIDGVNVKAKRNGLIPKKSGALKKNGLFLDPISVAVFDPITGDEMFSGDIFSLRAESNFGADIGMNILDQLELSTDLSPDAEATFETNSPWWATDLGGSATLADGVFTATGIYEPDSGVLSDYWDFVHAGDDIVKATLRSDVLTDSFNSEVLGMDFVVPLDPGLSDNMELDVVFSISAYSELETVPAPASLALLGLSGLAAARRRRA